MKRTVLWMALLALPLLGAAQPSDLAQTTLVLQGTAMNYTGDLNDQSLLNMPHAGWGVGICHSINKRWAMHVGATAGSVSATDRNTLRNLSFRSHVYELAATAQFNFWSYGVGATDKQWVFYLFGGLGLFHFNPQASYTDADGRLQWADLQPLRTEGQGSAAYADRHPYRRLAVCLPFGMGMKWRLNRHFTLGAELGLRRTWTDYLDDVSTTYADPDAIRAVAADAELAVSLADRSSEATPGYANAPGIKRGDDSLDDMYACFNLSLGISLETLFGWTHSKKCKN